MRFSPDIPINRGQLEVDELRGLAPFFRAAHTVGLAGLGEPFLHPRILDVIDFIAGHGAPVSITTNATLLTEKVAARLIGDRKIILSLSIDAADPAVFERVRLGARFDEVVANIDRLVAARKSAGAVFPLLSINTTLMRDTLDQVRGVVELARRWECRHISAQTVMFQRDCPDRSQAVDDREAREAIGRAAELARESGVEIRYVPLASDMDTLLEGEREERGVQPSYPAHAHSKEGDRGRFFCPNLWTQMVVDVTGDMAYCCMADREFQVKFGPLGNIRDTPPAALWRHPKMTALRRSLLQGRPPKECLECYALERFGRGKMLASWKADLKKLKYLI
jgi:MoaA/NifB/PqqE/SkfB family radical SAM enzyme